MSISAWPLHGSPAKSPAISASLFDARPTFDLALGRNRISDQVEMLRIGQRDRPMLG